MAEFPIAIIVAAVLGVAVVGALVVGWRRPFLGFGALVAGMAVHNVAIMTLVQMDAPPAIVRALQAWKEILIATLLIAAFRHVRRRYRDGWRPRVLLPDWIAAAFVVLVVAYVGIQALVGSGDASLGQRLVSIRLSLLPPLLYFLGRILLPRNAAELRGAGFLVLGAAAVVAVVGLWELWLIPTAQWIDWGAIKFSEWLGYDYEGPSGLPANFFHSTADGLALRRMVSTYISPLGVAYTGLLVVPLAAAVAYRPPHNVRHCVAWGLLAVITISLLFSVTRLALMSLAAAFVLLALLFWQRRALVAAAVAIVAIVAVLYGYERVGPVMTYDLDEVSSPTSFLREQDSSSPRPDDDPRAGEGGELIGRVISAQDGSVQGHIRAISYGLVYMVQHPAGTGPGTAVPRFGDSQGPGESALLRIGGELGIVGALLHVAMVAGAIWCSWVGFRRLAWGWLRAFVLVAFVGGLALIPIMLTSDVWGNFSVTFLFWWCAGLAVSVAAGQLDGTAAAEEGSQAPLDPVPA